MADDKKPKPEPKKKGFLSSLMESMNRTGGCCGPGESCCAPRPAKPDAGKKGGKP